MKEAKDLMTSNPVSCQRDHSAAKAVALMRRHDCGALPVVDSGHYAVGVVTDRDIALAAQQSGRALKDLPISEAMSSGAVVCHARDRIRDVESLMCRHQIRRILVVNDDRRVVGIISLSDLIRRGSKHRTGDPDPDRDVVGATLAAIVEPTQQPRSA